MALKDVGVKLVVEGSSKFGQQIDSADRKVSNFSNNVQRHSRLIGAAFVAMGTAIIAGGLNTAKTYAEMGDEVAKMAKRTGFSTEALSELRHAAQLSGTTLTGLEKASRTLSGTIVDANEGLSTYQRAFQRIGVNFEELQGMNPEEQFITVLEALAGVEDETIRAATAADLFGARMGTQLLPVMANGVDGLAEMRAEAHDLGVVFDEEAAVKAENLTDAMTRVNTATKGLQIAFAEGLLPALQPVLDTLTDIITPITTFLEKHPLLQKAVSGLTLAFGAFAVAVGTALLLNKAWAASMVVAAAKAAIFIPKLIVQAVAAVWSWAGAVPFVGAALAAGVIAGIYASIQKAKQQKGFAFGGGVDESGSYRVGERGPETVYLPRGASVQPMTQNTFNITENYARPEEPQNVDMTLRALAAYVK